MRMAKRFLFCTTLLIISIFILYVNIQMPLVGEDFTMQPWTYGSAPITVTGKIKAVWHKVYYSAILWNPRIGEALTTITAMFPKIIFDILNTGMFIWLLIVLHVIGFGTFPNWNNLFDSISLFINFFLIITIFPLLGQLFFWKAGTCNHIWGLTILLSFSLPYRLNHHKRLSIKKFGFLLIFLVFGFLAGLTVENAAVIVLGFLLILYLSSRMDDKIDGVFLFPIISFGIGTFLLLFSSGTSVRRDYYFSQGYDGDLSGAALYINRFTRLGNDFIELSWPIILIFFTTILIFIIISFYLNHNKRETRFPKSQGLTIFDLSSLYIASLISVFILISIAYQSDQQRGFALFWLISISLIAYLGTRILLLVNSKVILVLAIIVMVIFLGFKMIEIGNIYKQFALENNNRLNILYSGLTLEKSELILPAINTKDSRLIETREVLPDMGERIAIYYGFDNVEIEN